jgi:Ca2+-binding RTX toxin-like protein
MTRRTHRSALLAVLGSVALLPASAPAATLVRGADGALTYTAAPGTTTNFTVSATFDGSGVTVSGSAEDPVAVLPDGCDGGTYYGSHVVTCGGVSAVRADLGDGDDLGQVSEGVGVPVAIDGGAGADLLEGAEGADQLDGGPGDDKLTGGDGADLLRGGEGADTLEGRGGADRIEGGGGDDTLSPDGAEQPAADVVDGGAGVDTVTGDYASRFTDARPPLAITLAGGADDGRPGEGDDLRGVERVVSSVGGSFTGTDGADELRLAQVGSESTLNGLGGDDRLRGGDGPDRVDGGAGDDSLDGGFGDDTIVGGPGRDMISADLAGGDCGPLWCKHPYGNDRVEARDGEADSITCGAGRDLVVADAADVVAPDCEEVQRGGAAPGPGGGGPQPGRSAVRPRARIAVAGPPRLRTALARGLLVRLTGLRAGARTTVRAHAGRTVVATGRASADRRGRATVRLRFTAAARRSLRAKATVRLTVRAGGLATAVTLTRGAARAAAAGQPRDAVAADDGSAPAARAAAVPRVRTASFRVELEGVQRTSWTVDRNDTEGCDLWTRGGGSETIRFRSKPTTVTATWMGQTRVFTRGRETASLDLVATIARQGSVESGGEICSDGDGGGETPTTDCGTRRSRRTVELSYPRRGRDLIALRTDHDVPLGPFETCPSGGVSWPSLLDTHPVTTKPVGADLPVADLFRYGKNVVIAKDRVVQDVAGEHATTTIRWTLSFTRVGSRRGAR